MFLDRVGAVAVRHLRMVFRDFQHLSMLFYWPLIDIVLFGFTATWMQSGQPDALELNKSVLACVVLWQLVTRADLAISFGLLDELWSHNLVNLFGSPLRLWEWVLALVTFAIFMALAVFLYCIPVVYIIYDVNILSIGCVLVPIMGTLFLSGLWMGHFAASCLMFFGARVQILVWMMQWMLAPFIGVFYPVQVLPWWAQKISYMLPMTYAFEAVREVVLKKELNMALIGTSVRLNLVYCAIMMAFFGFMFHQSKKRGLARLVD